MKISEYVILQDAFENSFGFMLNRIADATDTDLQKARTEEVTDRCWREFVNALDEMGVTLQEMSND